MNDFLRPIALAGVTVGVVDGIAAVAAAATRGISPDRVFQYISSGILGRPAFDVGASTVLLGILLHFVIAFGAAAFFILSANRLEVLNRFPVVIGPLYGILVYFFMGEIVSPLSYTSRQPRTLSGTLIGIFVHVVAVGLPIALISSRWSREPRA